MATIKIGDVTGAIYQPERPLQLNPDGSAQASLTYKCASESTPAIVIPAYLSVHPFIPELKCYESTMNQEPGGIIVVTSVYKGVLVSDSSALAQHEYGRTTTEAPIETHPNFAVPLNNPPVTPEQLATIELALQNAQPPPATIVGAPRHLYTQKRRGIE